MTVGLTGGIGSGKTTVGAMFEDLGIPVYNSDIEAKKLMRSSDKIKKGIIALLGKEAYPAGVPDNGFIAGHVFGNEAQLEKLNAIIHPVVKKDFVHWVKQHDEAPYVVQEAAILFENGSYRMHDRMILVCAPHEVRIQRIKERDGSSRQAIEARTAHQWDDDRKARLADYVIENLDPEKTRSEVGRIHRELLKISGGHPF